MDRGCDVTIAKGWSGYCECEGGIRTGESDCKHQTFTCEAKCGMQWAYLRQQRQAKVSAMGAVEPVAFDADDSLTKLYKRGKGFYVMGNTELALRHFRTQPSSHAPHLAQQQPLRSPRLLLQKPGGRPLARGQPPWVGPESSGRAAWAAEERRWGEGSGAGPASPIALAA